jgi:DNA-binding NarL/FixJ family response regulator
MNVIKLVIADDHLVVRRGTRQILEGEPDFVVIGEAADGQETLKIVDEQVPDVVVLDIAMPILNGIEVTKQIKKAHPEIAILILSNYDNDEFVFGLLEAGAAGYLLKDVGSQDIINAIKAIKRGESVLHPVIASKVMKRFFPDPRTIKESEKILGDRELEVLRLAGKAQSNQEIADKLGLSPHTVEAHMRHIFAKLKVGSRTEAVLKAIKQGWMNMEDSP